MKNFVLNLAVGISMLSLVSCQKELVEPKTGTTETQTMDGRKQGDTCTDYFYYYNNQPTTLGQVSANQVVIGFQDGVTLQQKQNFIAGQTLLDSIIYNDNSGSADVTVATLKAGLTCAEVEALINNLNQNSLVKYANPTFNQAGYKFLGITNQFLVTLKPNFNQADLQQIATKSKTQIIGLLYGQTYILSAVKTSNGNALEMANYFHENNKVDYAEPDFLMVLP